MLNAYLQSNPTSPSAINLKACNHYRCVCPLTLGNALEGKRGAKVVSRAVVKAVTCKSCWEVIPPEIASPSASPNRLEGKTHFQEGMVGCPSLPWSRHTPCELRYWIMPSEGVGILHCAPMAQVNLKGTPRALSTLVANPRPAVRNIVSRCCRLYNGMAGEAELRVLLELQSAAYNAENDLVKHNTVVFRSGENALQVLPPLLDQFPEARYAL